MRKYKLVKEAKQILIEPRTSIGLNNKVTFGTEIELEYCNFNDIKNEVNQKLKNWNTRKDTSLICGAEIISPILTDNTKTWEELNTACDIASKYGNIYLYSNAGGHIHFGGQIFNGNINNLINLFKLWYTFEDVIIRFSNGEYLNQRHSAIYQAKNCQEKIKNGLIQLNNNKDYTLEDIKNIFKFYTTSAICLTKLKSLNENTMLNTIEFKCPNTTFSLPIWQNNINFFAKLLEYATSNNYDNEKVQSIKQNKNKPLNIEKAFQLSDLIFDNELDQLYFLRQYIKDGNMANNDKLVKSKTFVK